MSIFGFDTVRSRTRNESSTNSKVFASCRERDLSYYLKLHIAV